MNTYVFNRNDVFKPTLNLRRFDFLVFLWLVLNFAALVISDNRGLEILTQIFIFYQKGFPLREILYESDRHGLESQYPKNWLIRDMRASVWFSKRESIIFQIMKLNLFINKYQNCKIRIKHNFFAFSDKLTVQKKTCIVH